ncbi:MAG: hypothetical protein SVU69_10105 [Pseudomonadota bacterium]|nr:hypothetical protein [Pseudomonadota bacterium]
MKKLSIIAVACALPFTVSAELQPMSHTDLADVHGQGFLQDAFQDYKMVLGDIAYDAAVAVKEATIVAGLEVADAGTEARATELHDRADSYRAKADVVANNSGPYGNIAAGGLNLHAGSVDYRADLWSALLP